ncbi:MAG: DoxX family membrane protein [Syntrophobacterales bacterium]|nr:MAG: DoxX family membrane protein [Syntrophobacterales bacterium]
MKGLIRSVVNLYTSPYASVIFRWAVGLIFIYASMDKLLHPSAFAVAVYNYKILPGSLINLVAITLPWVELICGILLLIGLFPRATALILSILLLLFFSALSISLYRGIDISCGCFAVTTTVDKIGISYMVRDLLVLAMSVQILFFDGNLMSIERLLPTSYR